MFGLFQCKTPKLDEIIIPLALYNALKTDHGAAIDGINRIAETRANDARITDIRRDGRMLIVNFIRNGKLSTIKAYGDMSIDLAELRKEAGLE